MPIGNYSYSSDGEQRPFAITEPENDWQQSGRGHQQGYDQVEEERGVQAKEPERQSASRRGAQSGRGRSMKQAAYEEEDQPRGRSSQRSTARRGTQARRATDRGQTARRSATPEKGARQKKSRRGFAAMSPEQQREIARKGGLTVSRNRRHMADIGRIGGEHSHGGRRARR